MPGVATARGRLLRLEVENFKSYRGHQIIGPFKQFTAVIGPNGAGKSNLMDAISFVLGVRTAQLRGNLKELLYSNTDAQAAHERPSRGNVKLVYETDDGEEVHFVRGIVSSSAAEDATYQSQYKINDRIVSLDAYTTKLKTFGILVKARNFLVFQGDIESTAAKQPKELTAMFEAISGSEALRKDYDAAQAQMVAAESSMNLITSRKRAIGQEKRQKKEQKEEAERHLAMREELEELQRDYYLWQVFHLEHDIEKARKQAAKHMEAAANIQRDQSIAEKEVKEKKSAHAALVKERLMLEKNMGKKRNEADKKNPVSVKVREEVVRLTKKIKTAEAELLLKRGQGERQVQTIAKLQEDLDKINSAKEQLEVDLAAEAAGQGQLQMDDQMQADYNRMKTEAGAKTAKMAQDLSSLQVTQKAEIEGIQAQADTGSGISARIKQLEEELAKAEMHKGRVGAAIQEQEAQLTATRKELQDHIKNNRRTGAQRDHLSRKLEEVVGQLRNAKADRRETERERKMAEAVAHMKQLFPGVSGRVTELCKVTQLKYSLSFAVLMGKNIDSIICDTERTAKDCIQYLKEQGVAPMTFIPIQSVRAKPVNERLRHLGGTAKLALDVLQFEERLERAFTFICGNTLLCDTVKEAQQLAYMGPERHKVVAQDGTLFSKGGCITGGLTGNEQNRAARFEEQDTSALKQRRVNFEKELADIPGERVAAQEDQRLQSAIAGLEMQLDYKRLDLTATQAKLDKMAADVKVLTQERRLQAPGLAKVEKAVEERQVRIDSLQGRINEVQDRIFGAFGRKVGIDNIREYILGQGTVKEKAAAQRMPLAKQSAKLNSEMQYQKRNKVGAAIAKLEAEITADQERLNLLKKEEAAAKKAAEAVEAVAAQEQEAVAGLKLSAAEVDAEVKEMQKAAKSHNDNVAKAQRLIAKEESIVEQLQVKRDDAISAAAMDQVELPELESDGTAPMDTDDPPESGAASAPRSMALDFSPLKKQYRATVGAKERGELAAQFEDNVEEKKGLLERVAPNLKAVEQYEAVKEREREQVAELEEARSTAKAATSWFHGLKEERCSLFMAAFQHVADIIDTVYTELTRSSMHAMGGKADLSLENSEEPFLGGIKYFAVPPTKRYRDMDQLSGGEKTVAALALLFAIHSFQAPPFFVLDEIDAALDATNVARVAAYIRSKTRGTGNGFQSIVISLKDIFYEKADALIGVARDAEHGCSATYTFDLNAYH